MGIKNFKKIFKSYNIIDSNETLNIFLKSKNFKNISIDAYSEMYRIYKESNGDIKIFEKKITEIILGRKKYNLNEIWIFDYRSKQKEKFHLEYKIDIIKKRNKKTDNLKYKLSKFKEKLDENKTNIFKKEYYNNKINNIKSKLIKPNNYVIEKLKRILEDLNIKFIISPKGYDGEFIASKLTTLKDKNDNYKYDIVISSDSDCILFGSRNLCLINNNMFHIYNLEILLKNYNLSLEKLILICIKINSMKKIELKKMNYLFYNKNNLSIDNFSDRQKKLFNLYNNQKINLYDYYDDI